MGAREDLLARRESEATEAATAAAAREEQIAKHETELFARDRALSELAGLVKLATEHAPDASSSGVVRGQGLEEQLRIAKEKLEATSLAWISLQHMLEDTLRWMRRSMARAGLGRLVMETKGDSPGRVVLGLQQVCEHLEALPWAIQELATREGRGLAQVVAEHVLACYRSRDSNFLLEPAREGVVEAEGEAAREGIRRTAAEVAAGFRREAPPLPAPGDGPDDSDVDSTAD